ncbi:MAG: hypothetical protein QNJ16_04225 [Rhodobacter sp.]|nr:hypothetical protein [Rhodobacter sp.]
MEGLIILVVEFLAVLLWPVFALCAAALLALIEILFELVRALFGRRAARRSPAPRPEPVESPAARIERARAARAVRRRLVGFIGVPLAVALVPVILINLVFFDPMARWVTDRIAGRTGIDIAYDRIDGDLFTGKLAVEGLRVARPADAKPGFDVEVARVAADADLWTIFARERRLQALAIEGVTGRLEAGAPVPEDAGRPNLPQTDAERPKRAFAVANLQMADVVVDIVQHDRSPVRLEIIEASSGLFRSRHAAFDLFFRSNLEARVDDVSLVVETEELSERSRRTAWRLDKAPVEPIGDLVGRAPATWFRDGIVTVEVEDFWDLDDLTVDMDWRLFLADAVIAAPEGARLRDRALAAALNKVVQGRPDGVDLSFSLYLDEETFSATGSRDLSALWQAMRPALQQLLAANGIEITGSDAPPDAGPEPVEEAAKPTLGDRAKSIAGRVGGLIRGQPEE